MFGNEMLFTSWFFSSLLAVFLITLPLNSIFQKMSPVVRVILSGVCFLLLTYFLKFSIAKAFNVQDDAHVFELLKSKFTNFKNFHTLLYTCAVLNGVGASLLWTGQGTFLSINSSSVSAGRDAGIFWTLYQLSGVVGNIAVFFLFQGRLLSTMTMTTMPCNKE